jgi:hypothetical protein
MHKCAKNVTVSVRNAAGHHAAPMFFWGNSHCQGTWQFTAKRLILMGDWRQWHRSHDNEDADASNNLSGEGR